jgi:hypothetical protein
MMNSSGISPTTINGLFQSLDRIYIYDTKSGSFKCRTKNKITKSFSTKIIYFQIENEGLFEIEKWKAQLVSNIRF